MQSSAERTSILVIFWLLPHGQKSVVQQWMNRRRLFFLHSSATMVSLYQMCLYWIIQLENETQSGQVIITSLYDGSDGPPLLLCARTLRVQPRDGVLKQDGLADHHSHPLTESAI